MLRRLLGISDQSNFHQCLMECMFGLETCSEIETVLDASLQTTLTAEVHCAGQFLLEEEIWNR
jgi:hypothetical protein